MNAAWQEFVAGGLVVAAAVYLSYHIGSRLFRRRGVGCGSGCGSCSSNTGVQKTPKQAAGFVSVDQLRETQPSKMNTK